MKNSSSLFISSRTSSLSAERKPSPGLLHHSDRGSQYACNDYLERLNQYGMAASMNRKGNC